MKSTIASVLPLVVLASLSSVSSADRAKLEGNVQIESSDFDLFPMYCADTCTRNSIILDIGETPFVGSATALQDSKELYTCFLAPRKRLQGDTVYKFTAWSSPDGSPRFEPSDDKTGEYVSVKCQSAIIEDGKIVPGPPQDWQDSIQSRSSLGGTDMGTPDDGGRDEL